MRGWNKRRWGAGGRSQRSGISGQGAPVKFATLVFFEEFNGVNRGQRVRRLEDKPAKHTADKKVRKVL